MNIDDIINAIAETTAEALRNWDIERTIDEIRKEPDFIRLDDEIRTGKAIVTRFEGMGGIV